MNKYKNLFKILLGGLIPVLLICVISINWWGCKSENIVTPVSSSSVSQIAIEIENANTQVKAVAIINKIIQKVGIGVSTSGSSYSSYTIPTQIINDLASYHVQYLAGEVFIPIGSYFDSVFVASPRTWRISGNKELIFSRLKEKGIAALNSPENPDNAILMLIYTINGLIPISIELMDTLATKSPLQNFLFGVWMLNEFKVEIESLSDIGTCESPIACGAVYWLFLLSCLNENPLPFLTCQQQADNAYNVCCHSQGSGGG